MDRFFSIPVCQCLSTDGDMWYQLLRCLIHREHVISIKICARAMSFYLPSCCLPSGLVQSSPIRCVFPARRSRPCALPRWLTERSQLGSDGGDFFSSITLVTFGDWRAVGRMSSWICACTRDGMQMACAREPAASNAILPRAHAQMSFWPTDRR